MSRVQGTIFGSAFTITLFTFIDMTALRQRKYAYTRIFPMVVASFTAQLALSAGIPALVSSMCILQAGADCWTTYERSRTFFAEQRVFRSGVYAFLVCRGILVLVAEVGFLAV